MSIFESYLNQFVTQQCKMSPLLTKYFTVRNSMSKLFN